MNCQRAEELFSDRLEQRLDEPLRGELETHLQGCAACSRLCQDVSEVVSTLRLLPPVEPPVGLAGRAAAESLRRAPQPQPEARAWPRPRWLRLAAAGLALATGLGLQLSIALPSSRRLAVHVMEQTRGTGRSLAERGDRLMEDVKLLGTLLGTAFEGRVERISDRVDDYRRLLERRRRATPEPDDERKSGRKFLNSPQVAHVTPDGPQHRPARSRQGA